MIITIKINTEECTHVYAYNEDKSIELEYIDREPDELYLEEVINDFLT